MYMGNRIHVVTTWVENNSAYVMKVNRHLLLMSSKQTSMKTCFEDLEVWDKIFFFFFNLQNLYMFANWKNQMWPKNMHNGVPMNIWIRFDYCNYLIWATCVVLYAVGLTGQAEMKEYKTKSPFKLRFLKDESSWLHHSDQTFMHAIFWRKWIF